jgi:hypothetical protein
MNLNDLKKSLAGLLPREEAWKTGVCVQCRQPALPKCYPEAGRREYRISGMCEECFDELFKEEEDE